MKISNETIAILEDIENRLDPEIEDDFLKQWEDFLYNRFDGEVFAPKRKDPKPMGFEVEPININDAVEDYDIMLRMGLLNASKCLASSDCSPVIRASYGTGILSSLFGAEIFIMPREQNTLPTTKPFNDTAKIEEMIEKGIPDLMGGFGKKVFEFGEIFAETVAKYPKASKYLKVFHPDLQGPLDICELLWGGDMFYSMFDEPELVHSALSLITDTYTAFLNKWHEMYPCDSHMNPHWTTLWHRGKIFLRCDSAMNLSPDFYREFAKPYDTILLDRFDGGCMHFCGRGDHYIDILCDNPKLYGINLGQPGHNDMEKIFVNSVDKGIKVLGMNKSQYKNVKDRATGYNHSLHVRL